MVNISCKGFLFTLCKQVNLLHVRIRLKHQIIIRLYIFFQDF